MDAAAIPFERNKAVVPEMSTVSHQTHPEGSTRRVSIISITSTGDYYCINIIITLSRGLDG